MYMSWNEAGAGCKSLLSKVHKAIHESESGRAKVKQLGLSKVIHRNKGLATKGTK